MIHSIPSINMSSTCIGTWNVRTKGIGIFKLAPAKDDKHKRWRDEWVGELKKTREVDKDFRQKINEDKVYAFEKHFKDEMIEIFHSKKVIKKRLAFGAIPTLNMPKKSHEMEPIPSRRPLPDRPLWL
ncbi:uncharacterized protein LOC122952044 isoform X1 [Acropora millepora]|uniref:uncharacterized protein LOC122952044 isoform X1 n=1 Tax=Acropora millepora TaxID=45264 RepID=UPI001CF50C4E|nr:uncharacterized protein LOC122952044 isoform X1 [Acropora millepora]